MAQYLHKVAGIYTTRDGAEQVRDLLVQKGFTREQLHVLGPGESYADDKIEPESDGVLKQVVKDGVIGGVVGTGVGALGMVVMTAANVSLFLASPVLGPLTMLGWGASAGVIAGAAAGAGIREGRFADLVKDSVNSGHTVLIVHAVSEAQTKLAQDTIQESLHTGDAIKAV